MGILGRINRVIKSNVNDLVDRMSDPAKEVELLIIDMEKGIKTAREEVVTTLASAKRAKLSCERLEDEVDKWHGRAESAVKVGDDVLAKEALMQKMQVQRELESATQSYHQQNGHASELKSSLTELGAKLKDVKLRKESLKQRARAAKDGQKGLRGGKAFEEFDRLESRIEAMEETQDFSASLDGRDAATDAKFARLEQNAGGNPEIEDELSALKKRLEEGK